MKRYKRYEESEEYTKLKHSDIQKHVKDRIPLLVITQTIYNVRDGMDLQDAFIAACKKQKLYGDYSADDRYRISIDMKRYFNMEVDPNKGF